MYPFVDYKAFCGARGHMSLWLDSCAFRKIYDVEATSLREGCRTTRRYQRNSRSIDTTLDAKSPRRLIRGSSVAGAFLPA